MRPRARDECFPPGENVRSRRTRSLSTRSGTRARPDRLRIHRVGKHGAAPFPGGEGGTVDFAAGGQGVHRRCPPGGDHMAAVARAGRRQVGGGDGPAVVARPRRERSPPAGGADGMHDGGAHISQASRRPRSPLIRCSPLDLGPGCRCGRGTQFTGRREPPYRRDMTVALDRAAATKARVCPDCSSSPARGFRRRRRSNKSPESARRDAESFVHTVDAWLTSKPGEGSRSASRHRRSRIDQIELGRPPGQDVPVPAKAIASAGTQPTPTALARPRGGGGGGGGQGVGRAVPTQPACTARTEGLASCPPQGRCTGRS